MPSPELCRGAVETAAEGEGQLEELGIIGRADPEYQRRHCGRTLLHRPGVGGSSNMASDGARSFRTGGLLVLDSAPQRFCFASLTDEFGSATSAISDGWSSSLAGAFDALFWTCLIHPIAGAVYRVWLGNGVCGVSCPVGARRSNGAGRA